MNEDISLILNYIEISNNSLVAWSSLYISYAICIYNLLFLCNVFIVDFDFILP